MPRATQKPRIRSSRPSCRISTSDECSNVHRGLLSSFPKSPEPPQSSNRHEDKLQRASSMRQRSAAKSSSLSNDDRVDQSRRAESRRRQAWCGRGDEILITGMEHHSNIVPWQLLCERTGARTSSSWSSIERSRRALVMDEFERAAERSHADSFHVGLHFKFAGHSINPVEQIIEIAHAKCGAPVLLDGAQAVGHATRNRRTRRWTAISYAVLRT